MIVPLLIVACVFGCTTALLAYEIQMERHAWIQERQCLCKRIGDAERRAAENLVDAALWRGRAQTLRNRLESLAAEPWEEKK